MFCCAVLLNIYGIGVIGTDHLLGKFGCSFMTAGTKPLKDGDGIDHDRCAHHCFHRKQQEAEAKPAESNPDDDSSSSIATTATSASTSTSPSTMPSFYQRKLPDTCVAFASPEGKKIFRSALRRGGLKSFYNLIEQHHTQTEPAFCGISTRAYNSCLA